MLNIDPAGFLYQKPLAIPFPDYAPESEVGYKQRVVVARLPEQNNSGFHAVVYENRVPAVLMQGHIHDNEKPVLRVSIGTGADTISVLYALCKGFSDGSVALEPAAEHTVQVSMWEVKGDDGAYAYFAPTGAPLPLAEPSMVTMYFTDSTLARKAARDILDGMLGVRWYKN